MTHIGHSEKVTVMRVLITVIILIFSFQSWARADDIRDFQIEGMSLGDSALDFFTVKELNKRKKFYLDEINYFSYVAPNHVL